MVKITPTGRFHNYLYRLKTSLVLTIFFVTRALCSLSQPFEVDTIMWTGPASDRINMVFLSDGYQNEELPQYIQDVNQVAEHFFRQSPFRFYRQYFNLIAIKVPSKESGAKKDPTDEHDTYFGSTFNYSGIERLLVAQKGFAAQEILFEQFPLFDQAVLIVNDQKYGGSGGWLATTSVHENAPEIALHEIGHSFAGLADEYWAGEQFAAEKPNMTQSMNSEMVPWRNWLGFAGVGIYTHAENPLWARPHQNCKMRVLNPEFCSVCQETLVKRIHDLTNPIITYQPGTATLIPEDSIVFKIDFLEPNPNSLQVQWHVDQMLYDSYDRLVLQKDPEKLSRQINVSVLDTTHLVRDIEHLNKHTYSLNWEIKSDSTTSNLDHLVKTKVHVYPNPVTDLLQIEISNVVNNQAIKLMVRDLAGKLVYQVSGTSSLFSIPLGQIPVGSYFITISGDRISGSIPFIKQ